MIKRLRAASKFPAKSGWVLSYNGRTESGGEYTYSLHAERVLKSGDTEFQDLTLTTPVPPAEDELLAESQGKSGRPDAYEWSVDSKPKGMQLTIKVLMQRTEWHIESEVADDKGPVHPAETDTTFFGQSQFTPPAPAAP